MTNANDREPSPKPWPRTDLVRGLAGLHKLERECARHRGALLCIFLDHAESLELILSEREMGDLARKVMGHSASANMATSDIKEFQELLMKAAGRPPRRNVESEQPKGPVADVTLTSGE